MKLSISLTDEDVALMDEFARATGLGSRSAVVRQALRMLRHPDLESDYAAAWDEWDTSVEGAAWEATEGDGLMRAQG